MTKILSLVVFYIYSCNFVIVHLSKAWYDIFPAFRSFSSDAVNFNKFKMVCMIVLPDENVRENIREFQTGC